MISSEHASEGNRLSDVIEGEFAPNSLVGSFFHRPLNDDWTDLNQGCVVAEPMPGVYLVEMFDFLVGGSTHQELARIEDMTGWRFFDSSDWMDSFYRNMVEPRIRRQELRQKRRAENGAGKQKPKRSS